MCHAFERLRVIREYRSPRTIRSFTKVFIFLMPIVLSPYYVHMGIKSGNMWSPYYIAVLTSFIFGTLQGVQDVLDDPFDGISEDDINLGPVRSLFMYLYLHVPYVVFILLALLLPFLCSTYAPVFLPRNILKVSSKQRMPYLTTVINH